MSPLSVVAQIGAIGDAVDHYSPVLSTFNQWRVDMNASSQQDDAPSRLNQIVFAGPPHSPAKSVAERAREVTRAAGPAR
jgi:hypothetical protein